MYTTRCAEIIGAERKRSVLSIAWYFSFSQIARVHGYAVTGIINGYLC